MKKLIIILLMFISAVSVAQTERYIEVPKAEMLELINTINRQIIRDSLQVKEIDNLRRQIFKYDQLQLTDSILMNLGKQRTILYREELDLYKNRVIYLEKSNNHWTKKPVIWFMIGAGSLYVASLVVKNVN